MRYQRKQIYNKCVRFSHIQNFIKRDSYSVKDLDRLNSFLTFLECAESSCSLSTSVMYAEKPLFNTNDNL